MLVGISTGYDAGVRLGEVIEGDMIALPVSDDQRQLAVCAPGYLARQGAPTHPRDLAAHRCRSDAHNLGLPVLVCPHTASISADDVLALDAVAGKLSIKGATQDVVAPVTLTQSGATTVATGSFPIKRLAFKIGEKADDPLQMYLADIFTISCNLVGNCGISIPCGFTSAGLPIGMQVGAAAFGEDTILRVAAAYQTATDWHTRRAPLD